MPSAAAHEASSAAGASGGVQFRRQNTNEKYQIKASNWPKIRALLASYMARKLVQDLKSTEGESPDDPIHW
jgi:hypothetical protein